MKGGCHFAKSGFRWQTHGRPRNSSTFNQLLRRSGVGFARLPGGRGRQGPGLFCARWGMGAQEEVRWPRGSKITPARTSPPPTGSGWRCPVPPDNINRTVNGKEDEPCPAAYRKCTSSSRPSPRASHASESICDSPRDPERRSRRTRVDRNTRAQVKHPHPTGRSALPHHPRRPSCRQGRRRRIRPGRPSSHTARHPGPCPGRGG